MNREEYLERLKRSLRNIPDDEAENIIRYYREYFEDAGEENEQSVIEELGSCELLAVKVSADYIIKDIERQDGIQQDTESQNDTEQKAEENQYSQGAQSGQRDENHSDATAENNQYQQSNQNYQQNQYNQNYQKTQYSQNVNAGRFEGVQQEKAGGQVRKGMSNLWIIVLAICAFPVWLPLVIVAAALLFSAVIIVMALLFSAAAVGAAVICGGVAAIIGGICMLFVHIPTGIMSLGMGSICVGIGFLAIWVAAAFTKMIKYLFINIAKIRVKKGVQ